MGPNVPMLMEIFNAAEALVEAVNSPDPPEKEGEPVSCKVLIAELEELLKDYGRRQSRYA